MTDDFIVHCLLQHTEQGGIEWFRDKEHGGYYAVIKEWSVRVQGCNIFFNKGAKNFSIIVETYRFINKDKELRKTVGLLLAKIRECFPEDEKELTKTLSEQEQSIKKDFCGTLMGWSK